MRGCLVVAAAIVVVPLYSASLSASEEEGKAAFNNNCRTCHSWKAGDNRLGPNLHGIVGRKAGSAEGFGYSGAVKSSGITWDDATLDKFIANPNALIPNNNMKTFGGVGDEATRKQIIEFLKTNPD